VANALKEQGKLDEAIASYNKTLAIKPDYAEAYNNMGNALKDQGKLDEAIEAYNKALAIKPDFAEAYYNMGNALKEQGKLDEAIAPYNKALSFKPDYAEAYNNKGNALKDQGKLDEAIDAYSKALSLKPDYAEAHRNLSSIIKYDSNHPQVAAVDKMTKRSDLNDDDRCNLHFAFAKMSEDIGDLDVAFENYVAGGRLRQKLLSYDPRQDEIIFNQIKTTALTIKDTFFNKPAKGAPHTPIFILGMPRSGTTLVEQIISSHSHVHGAGELEILRRLAAPFNFGNKMINSDSIFQLRKAYLDELAKVSNGSNFVTDKMPRNFQYIGLILKALPEAKIIHTKRDPAATCWSNFKNYFSAKGLGYSYDLEDTVGYFKLYQDLMYFWDDLYGDQIYHLDYDRLTVEQETETRKLIEHMELGWEDACLSPQENKRSVRTASQQQVREKVYTGSSDAWRKFEPYLNGLFDELEQLI
jgi:tetratricopeptide (TPR) repeat protein